MTIKKNVSMRKLWKYLSNNIKFILLSTIIIITIKSIDETSIHSFFMPIGFLIILIYDFIQNKNIQEKVAYLLFTYFLWYITYSSGHPLFFALAIFTSLEFLRQHTKNGKKNLRTETIIIIILTLVTIQITYPIFKPRIEIISLEKTNYGIYENDLEYGWRDIVISITPPLLNTPKEYKCTNIIFGQDTKYAYNKETPLYGIKIEHNEKSGGTNVCTYGVFDFTKRLVTIQIMSQQKLNLHVADENITWFSWITNNNSDIRIHKLYFHNYGNIPIFLRENLTFYITNETELDQSEKMVDYIFKHPDRLNCILNNFYLTYEDKDRTQRINTQILDNNKIKLIINPYYHLPPNNDTILQINFDITKCEDT